MRKRTVFDLDQRDSGLIERIGSKLSFEVGYANKSSRHAPPCRSGKPTKYQARSAVPFAVMRLPGFQVDGTWNVPTTLTLVRCA